MSLRTRLLIFFCLALISHAIAGGLVQRFVLFPSFLELERSEAFKNLHRSTESIQRELHHLSTLASDWSAWDATWNYLHDRDEQYIASNLTPQALAGIKLHLFHLYDREGNLIWGRSVDQESGAFSDTSYLSPNNQPTIQALLQHDTLDSHYRVLLISSAGPMLLVSQPVITSEHQGPIRGTLMMGRLLNAAMMQTLMEQTHVPLQLWIVGSAAMPASEQQLLPRLRQSTGPILIEQEQQPQLSVYTLLRDYHDQPILLLRADTGREISQKGQTVGWITTLMFLGFSLLTLLILYVGLRALVLHPITALTHHLQKVGREGDLTQRFQTGQNDEIGALADSFNHMAASFMRIVHQLYLHTHSLSACVHALTGAKQSLEQQTVATAQLSRETMAAYHQLEDSLTTIDRAVDTTTGQVVDIAAASSELKDSTTTIAATTRQADNQIHAMAQASQGITGNIDEVRQHLDQVDESIHAVTQAIANMGRTMRQVRQQSQQARAASEQANDNAAHANQIMQRLTDAVCAIDSIVEIIGTISEQTNMLSLNASIEAAGAGSAGTGFSVVANEIKELAHQTAQSTRMISQRIAEIQSISREASNANATITEAIESINQGNYDIALAMEMQDRSVKEISLAMDHVAHASRQVAGRVQDLGAAAHEVANAAMTAADHTRGIDASVSDASLSAATLAEQGDRLDEVAQQMRQAVQQGLQAGQRADDRLTAIVQQIATLTGVIDHIAALIAVIAIPGQKLRQATASLVIGSEPFDIGGIKQHGLAQLRWLQETLHHPPADQAATPMNHHPFLQWCQSSTAASYRALPEYQQALELQQQLIDQSQLEQFRIVQSRFFDYLDLLYDRCTGVVDEQS
ncbi:MAG: HAMP domain-containing protein [Magnetococcales bacterium]|nr:HAMP domain-containing protein [Magnetococcales bacterium]